MILGSHNSMSYLKPKKWYLYPFRFIAKCQNKTIQEQYEEYKVRVFDIRIAYNKNGIPEFRHGTMSFKGVTLEEILEYLNKKRTKPYVRLILELNKCNKDTTRQTFLFKQDCQRFQDTYTNIRFFGAFRKFDWEQIFEFKLKDLDINQKVSSMQGNKIDDLWPWLYAKLNNKKSIKEGTKHKCLMLDFIDIR